MDKLFFWWGMDRTDIVHSLHMYVHEWVELWKTTWKQTWSELKPENRSSLCYPNSTARNILIRDQNSEFYPLLERLQNSPGFWYSGFPQNSFWSGIKVQICPDNSICPELTPPPTSIDRNSWIISRMRLYLYFLEMYQNYLSLSYCALFLIRHHVQSEEFCEIVICPNQNL
jgi:hypothetical protein